MTQEINSDIVIRSLRESDKPFIFNSWLKSLKSASYCSHVPDKIYYSYNHAVINKILSSENSKIFIASAPDDESFIHGYVVAEQSEKDLVVHLVYVKFFFRNAKVAKSLLTHLTQNVEHDEIFYQQFIPNVKNFVKGVKCQNQK